MHITRFTITQDGQRVGGSAALEQAVSIAAIIAAHTGRPVSVIAHLEDGGSKEAIFNPDGTNEKIWTIDKGQSLTPEAGRVYINRGGGRFRCLSRIPTPGPMYYNQAGGSSDTSGVFRNVRSGWTFTAKGIIQYVDGTIEWDHSCDGRFEEKEDDRA